MTRVIIGLPGSDRPKLVDMELPSPVGHQVSIDIIATGLCHSQLNQLDQLMRAPETSPGRLLGHEALATVSKVGPRATSVKPGDNVLVSWLPRREVLGKRKAQTVDLVFDGSRRLFTPDVFTWAERSIADEAYLYPSSSTHPAMSVLGCAVLTGAGAVMNSARLQPGESVAVIGAGGVGCSAIVAARALGAKNIFAIDLNEAKLALAERLGATHVVNVTQVSLTDTIARWAEQQGTSGVDHVIDCVATPRTFSDALAIVRRGQAGFGPGGNVVIVGVAHRAAELDVRFIQLHGISIKGCFGGDTQGDQDIYRYEGWLNDKRFKLRDLVTNSYNLDDVVRAVTDLREGRIIGRGVLEMCLPAG